MSGYKIELTLPARKDLEIIQAFISEQSPSGAATVTERILNRLQQLSEFPESGPVLERMTKDRRRNYRSIVEGNYRLVYYVEGRKVSITQIMDCRQDPGRMR